MAAVLERLFARVIVPAVRVAFSVAAGLLAAPCFSGGLAAVDPQARGALRIHAGVATERDIAPHGSELMHTPSSVDQVVAPGTVVRRQLTLTNTGSVPLQFALRVRRGPTADASAVSLDAGEAWGIYSWPGIAQTMFVQFPDIGRPDWWVDRFVVPGTYVAGSFSGPDLTWFYAIAHPDRLRKVHVYEMTATDVGVATPRDPGARWTSLASAPDGSLYALAVSQAGASRRSTLYTLHAGDATATPVGDIPAVELDGLAFDADGTLYAVGSGALYILDRANARATRVGPVDAYDGATPLAANQATGQLYRVAQATSARLLALDKTNGTETYRGSLPRDLKLTALSFVSDGIGPWARVTPRAGTLPAGATMTIELELDATQVPRPSSYEASLNIEGAFANTPSPIPLTMRVGCASCGGASGQVSDGTDGRPVVALLRFDDGTTSLETSGNRYDVDLPAGQYAVTATAAGYLPYAGTLAITTGGSATAHIALERADRLFWNGFDAHP